MRGLTPVWIVAFGLLSLSPVSADDASRLATAREIVGLTHSADNLKALLPQLMNSIRPMLTQQGADQKTIDTLLKSGEAHMSAQTSEMVDLIAHIYAEEFSEEDLNSLLAFDKTPAGEHLIEKQPALMRGMLAVGQQWGRNVARQVLEDYARQKAEAPTLTP